MDAQSDSSRRARTTALYAIALATFAIIIATVASAPLAVRYGMALLGAWLLLATLVRYAARPRHVTPPLFRRPIPIRFGGNVGRFTLRSFGDGRRVEVRAGSEIVAEAIATDERDELVIHLDAVEDRELDALGAAIGEAIVRVAASDEAAASTWAMPARAARARIPTENTGLLRTIGPASARRRQLSA